MTVQAFAPGRINLIGDHTDYTGGYVLPMAIELGTTVRVTLGSSAVTLESDAEPGDAFVPLDVSDVGAVRPYWARYVAGVIAELRPGVGATGSVRTTLPVGGGLSSSAALEVALALVLGYGGDAIGLAQLCQRAEQRATGVRTGIMDQLASAAGEKDCLLLIDCRSLCWQHVAFPEAAAVVAVHSGQARALAASAYSDRRDACDAIERRIGPLREATAADVARLTDPVLRRRARHVVSENQRVLDFRAALESGDLEAAGVLMLESHVSLRDDFEVSTQAVDELVERLAATPGVWGARMTGGGFGGVVVALAEEGAAVAGPRFRPVEGARVTDVDADVDGDADTEAGVQTETDR